LLYNEISTRSSQSHILTIGATVTTHLAVQRLRYKSEPSLGHMTPKPMSDHLLPAIAERVAHDPPAPVTHGREESLENHRRVRVGGYLEFVSPQFGEHRSEEKLPVCESELKA
jgi:hypothetical protein